MARPTFSDLWDYIRRYPAGALSIALCLPAAGSVFVLRNMLTDADRNYEKLNEKGVAMSEYVAGVRNIRTQAAAAHAAADQIEAGLIDESNLAENLWYFYQIEQQTHARISELRQLSSTAPKNQGYYKVVPFSLRVAGNYEQVSGYLYHLETGPRMLRVNSFEIQRQESAGNNLLLVLTLDVLARP